MLVSLGGQCLITFIVMSPGNPYSTVAWRGCKADIAQGGKETRVLRKGTRNNVGGGQVQGKRRDGMPARHAQRLVISLPMTLVILSSELLFISGHFYRRCTHSALFGLQLPPGYRAWLVLPFQYQGCA
jgi:hypothetical protein